MACGNISTFEDLDTQLQNVMIAFLQNENICKLLHYNTPDALSQPPVENSYELLSTRIYNQTYKPPSNEESTYITVFFDNFDAVSGNPYLKHGRLYLNVMTHRNLWNIDGGLRVIKIMAEIDKILNKNHTTNGLTRDFFKSARYLPINDLYNSYAITYTNIDAQ